MAKRLIDLNPEFLSSGGPGCFSQATGEPLPERKGVAISFDCPCGCNRRMIISFKNPISPGPEQNGWLRTGDTFETMTLTPSMQRMDPDGCHWHGFLTDGELRTA